LTPAGRWATGTRNGSPPWPNRPGIRHHIGLADVPDKKPGVGQTNLEVPAESFRALHGCARASVLIRPAGSAPLGPELRIPVGSLATETLRSLNGITITSVRPMIGTTAVTGVQLFPGRGCRGRPSGQRRVHFCGSAVVRKPHKTLWRLTFLSVSRSSGLSYQNFSMPAVTWSPRPTCPPSGCRRIR
jgi:hypothetical protein